MAVLNVLLSEGNWKMLQKELEHYLSFILNGCLTLLHWLSCESLFSRVADLLRFQLCNVHRCSLKRLHSKKMKAICFIPQFGTFCHASCLCCVTGHTEHQELMHVNDCKELTGLLDDTHTHTYRKFSNKSHSVNKALAIAVIPTVQQRSHAILTAQLL